MMKLFLINNGDIMSKTTPGCDASACSASDCTTTDCAATEDTSRTASSTTVDADSSSTKQSASIEIQELTQQQEIGALRAAHSFFSSFTGVPGHSAAQWGQALDAIAVVANSLIKKSGALNVTGADDSASSEEGDAQSTESRL